VRAIGDALGSTIARAAEPSPPDAPAPELRERDVVERLRAARVLPVATIEDAEQAVPLGCALRDGGLPCLEVALRTPAAAEALRAARTVDGLLVGAGTVLSPELAERAAEAGADFAVAPGLNEDVVRACRELGLPFFPGVATPTEIERGRALGLTTLKLFPAAQLGGPAYIRAVSATYRDVEFLPTGGIRSGDVTDYLAVPSVLACGGSWLVTSELLAGNRFDEIERLAREARAA
jgi:2-dehydro-3-deoxyphosphogluconate aldolase/(4S)-4-hydroxy-2-oxoglutarate aldolase